MDNIKHYEKWKKYQKEYVKKNREKMNAYGRNYYKQNKEKFKIYYDKYKKKKNDKENGIISNEDSKCVKSKYARALERENKKNELLLQKAREYRNKLLLEGYNTDCLGDF